MNALSDKKYLQLKEPDETDTRSYLRRIEEALEPEFGKIRTALPVLSKLYPCCDESGWKLTALLVKMGEGWELVGLEKGNTEREHYGICVDLGSTTVVMQQVDCGTGKVLAQVSVNNGQIAWGDDILTRIFYCKDSEEHLRELTEATRRSICEGLEKLKAMTGIPPEKCLCMTVSGNAAMMHFLYGMDPFCVFSSPYALRADHWEDYSGKELGFPLAGRVYSVPAKANYLGGDIISGILATDLDRQEELCVFLDIGTNGELVIGNREFLLCGAGAAGPALEGGVVRTGMRAEEGAVSYVKLKDGEFLLTVIGDTEPRGICGSGIVDLLAELFLNGWVDIKGRLQEEKSDKIAKKGEEQELAVEYAPGLWFFQSDITEFLKTKAAAHTMVEYLMKQIGLHLGEIGKFYVAGAFGTYLDVESAVTIGLYPDLPRERLLSAGNASLDGARYYLLHREAKERMEQILDKMEYVQFGAVEDFLHLMVAAEAIPHTNPEHYRYREDGC